MLESYKGHFAIEADMHDTALYINLAFETRCGIKHRETKSWNQIPAAVED
jgi:hypothetical protein